MQPINPATEGLVKIDAYQRREHPVKPKDEIWASLTAEELQLLAEGAELVVDTAYQQLRSFREDLAAKGVGEDSELAKEQMDYHSSRVERATALLGGLRTLANNPEALASYSKQVY